MQIYFRPRGAAQIGDSLIRKATMPEDTTMTLPMHPAFWEGRAKQRDALAESAEDQGLYQVAREHRRAAAAYRDNARRCTQ